MGEVIYGVVFGKPKTDGDGGIQPSHGIDRFSDDVYRLPPLFSLPWWDLPSDTEPPNEPA